MKLRTGHVLTYESVRVQCAASVKIMYEPQPTPRKISALAEKTIRAIACGHNHTLALDTEQAAYTWGKWLQLLFWSLS